MSNIRELAAVICDKLLSAGFTVQRYDAYTTDSIYLKLDFGASNSIRISDHHGKARLRYRFNIGPNFTVGRKKVNGYDRFYYSDADVDKMIRRIESEKQGKMQRYGEDKYKGFMEKNRKEGEGKSGFWAQARLVEQRGE